MGLMNLPPELRLVMYNHRFNGSTFRRTRPARQLRSESRQQAESWLFDIFAVCKEVNDDIWLTQAILRNVTFYIKDIEDLEWLQERFGIVALQQIKHVKISQAMCSNDMVNQLQASMPRLRHIGLPGRVSPLRQVWNRSLENFDRHPWVHFVACLCVFAPGEIPGPCAVLTDQGLTGLVDLVVEFEWADMNLKLRRMRFSTKDWMLRYKDQGKDFALSQVRPENLQAVLDEGKGP